MSILNVLQWRPLPFKNEMEFSKGTNGITEVIVVVSCLIVFESFNSVRNFFQNAFFMIFDFNGKYKPSLSLRTFEGQENNQKKIQLVKKSDLKSTF